MNAKLSKELLIEAGEFVRTSGGIERAYHSVPPDRQDLKAAISHIYVIPRSGRYLIDTRPPRSVR